MTGFVEFKGVGQRSLGPVATTTKYGVINLNRVFMEEFYNRGKFVNLLWNKDKQVIGLRFEDERKPGSYTFRVLGGGKLGVISCLSFLRFIRLKLNKPRRFKVVRDEKTGLALIDLKQRA